MALCCNRTNEPARRTAWCKNRGIYCVRFTEMSSADASHSRGMKQIKLHGYVNSECDWGDQDTVFEQL